MAYQYDEMGNVIGEFETEEERRQREEAAKALTSKVEVKTYGDGSQTKTTTQEMAAPVAAPIAPDTTYGRMVQAESGGRDFDAQGRPLTSPAGAMFASQVMPATAAQPGFGVRPAQAQTPEEYNRVGQEYYQALLKKYNGNEQLAAAAYNMGPGAVDKNIARNQGQFNVAQAPQETQGYLDKVLGGVSKAVNAVIPSAQAGTLPAGQFNQPPTITPVAPQTQPAINPETGETYQQLVPQGAAPTQTAQPAPASTNPLLDMQNDPIQMLAAVKDPTTSEADKKWMSESLRDKYLMDINMNNAKKDVMATVAAAGAGDRKAANTIAKELQNQEGSWAKMILLSFISPQLAGEEAIKLGFGNKWVQGYSEDGKPAMIQVNAKGLPLKGYDDKGIEIDTNSLPAYMMGGGKTKADVSTQDVEKNGQAGRVITQHLPGGQTRTMVESGGKMFPYDTSWKPRSIATSAEKRLNELNLKLQYAGPTKVAEIVAEDEALHGALPPATKAAILERATTAAPAMGRVTGATTAPATTGAGTSQAQQQQAALEGKTPTAAGAAPGTAAVPETTIAGRRQDVEVTETSRKEIVKKASDVIAGADKIVTDLIKVEGAAQDALSKPNNFGTIIHGMIPGEQTIGKVFKTQDHINTMNILEQVNKQAAINAKMLGANPTDRDLQFVTSTKPDETWSQEAVADWLRKSAEGTRRTLDFARKQVESGGRYIPPTPQAGEGGETMTPADKARAELERRRKKQ